MRLLFLTSRLPYPPNRGDRLRVFNFIRTLAGEHQIDLISFIADADERKNIDNLKPYCRKVQVVPLSAAQSALSTGLNTWRPQPLQVSYYRSADMQALVDRTLSETRFDAVYVHLFRMAPYLLAYSHLYRIVDLTDVISQELIRSMPYRGMLSKAIYALEHPRIERYERWVANHFDESWLISEHDRSVLAETCPQANLQVIRNGVDTESLYPTGESEISDSLLFVGHMGVFHNVDAASFLVQEILPRVCAEIPEVSVRLVGADPAPKVQSLASIQGVEVSGFVPDLNAVLNQAAVFVAPLRFAAGVQNKVLEAMAAGRPIVTTSLVNQGLSAQPDRDLLIADTPDEIAAAIRMLLRDPNFCKRLGSSARQFVQTNYRWDFVAERMKVIQETL